MLKLSNLIISPESLGERLWLTDVVAVFEYKDNRKTENIVGYRYVIVLPDRNFDKIGVKIEGAQQLKPPENGSVDVRFDNLELFIYMMNGSPQIGARATKITLANTKT